MVKAGDVLGGKYKIERLLAKGGMGSIWIARDLKLYRSVAVKFVDASFANVSDVRGRFEREARAVAQLRTPHVVQVYDHGLDQEAPYIVMEHLEGEDLYRRLKREGRLSLAATSTILHQAAKGLRRAHEAGIIHRDMKPSNVFLARVDDEEVVKILDFGVAKLLDLRAMTIDGEVLGSPRYMSPEQLAQSKDLDLRSDLWSMGVILYRAVTGKDAFTSRLVDAVMAIRNGAFAPATEAAPDLGAEVDRFFARALAVDPDRRFSSAREMAEAFAELEVAEARRAAIAQAIDATDTAADPTARLPPPAVVEADTAPSAIPGSTRGPMSTLPFPAAVADGDPSSQATQKSWHDAAPQRQRAPRSRLAVVVGVIAVGVAALGFVASRGGAAPVEVGPAAPPAAGAEVAATASAVGTATVTATATATAEVPAHASAAAPTESATAEPTSEPARPKSAETAASNKGAAAPRTAHPTKKGGKVVLDYGY